MDIVTEVKKRIYNGFVKNGEEHLVSLSDGDSKDLIFYYDEITLQDTLTQETYNIHGIFVRLNMYDEGITDGKRIRTALSIGRNKYTLVDFMNGFIHPHVCTAGVNINSIGTNRCGDIGKLFSMCLGSSIYKDGIEVNDDLDDDFLAKDLYETIRIIISAQNPRSTFFDFQRIKGKYESMLSQRSQRRRFAIALELRKNGGLLHEEPYRYELSTGKGNLKNLCIDEQLSREIMCLAYMRTMYYMDNISRVFSTFTYNEIVLEVKAVSEAFKKAFLEVLMARIEDPLIIRNIIHQAFILELFLIPTNERAGEGMTNIAVGIGSLNQKPKELEIIEKIKANINSYETFAFKGENISIEITGLDKYDKEEEGQEQIDILELYKMAVLGSETVYSCIVEEYFNRKRYEITIDYKKQIENEAQTLR